jgi:hypothetical protein
MRKPRKGILAQQNRGSYKITPAQKEAILCAYYMNGSFTATSKQLGLSYNTVRRIVQECQLDPAYAHVRAQAFDNLASKIHATTDAIIDSITPEELVTTHHKVYDVTGNLLRVVTEGPGLKDKAIAVGVMADKQAILQNARAKALESGKGSVGAALLLPEDIDDMKRMLATKMKRLRVMDIQFDNSDIGEHVNKLLTKVGVSDADYVEEETLNTGAAPFD